MNALDRETAQYELRVRFSEQLDTWGMVATPDDWDFRSHDYLVTEYQEQMLRRGTLHQLSSRDDLFILNDYANWLDHKGVLTNAGPHDDGLREAAERFLREDANGKAQSR